MARSTVPPQEWKPIDDLPADWKEMVNTDIHALARVWAEQAEKLRKSSAYTNFLARLRRKIAIETGVIERLYTIDRGITLLLIERGIDEALIPHGATDRPAAEVIAFIQDHETAIEGLFKFVAGKRELSISYIKQLHQALTQHQDYTRAKDQFGRLFEVELVRGDWKKNPNNPTRPDGTLHYYCPPEQVAPQMEALVRWHLIHENDGISPEVEAAWLHHRFTQIHPFQDGNGRVARCLSSLVFIRAGWFPLVIDRDDREDYIESLEAADQGDLKPLVNLFARSQRHAFIESLSLSEQAISETESFRKILSSVVEKLKQDERGRLEDARKEAEEKASTLFAIARQRFTSAASEIETALHNITRQPEVFARYALSDDERSNYYRYQIIETARKLDYYANLSGYKCWVNLTIKINGLQTEILLSFHILGYEHRGILVCSACAYHKAPSGEGEAIVAQDIEPLSQSPFQITYLAETQELERQFNHWLEDVLKLGLEYWRKGL